MFVINVKIRDFINTFIIAPLSFSTIILIIGWIIYFIVKCWRIYKEYKTCKQTPVLHPLYSDVQYLSKQRKLYNLKTHLTKYILMIVCCSFEVASFIGAGSYLTLEWKLLHSHDGRDTSRTDFVMGFLHCKSIYGYLPIYDEYPFVLPTLHSFSLLFGLHLTLLAILSRYLAMRYLNHPFKQTLIKYLIWCFIQCILIEFCSTKYTWIFMVFIIPFINLTNWILLLRATSILSRVLRSHLMDIKLYSNNRVFYNAQLSAYNFYRIFRIVSLISTFFLILVEALFFVWRSIKIFMHYPCQLQIGQKTIIQSFHSNNRAWLQRLILLIDSLIITVYLLSLFLPLCGITFAPLIIKCVKRCTEKEDQYRYNYEKLEPLLRRRHI